MKWYRIKNLVLLAILVVFIPAAFQASAQNSYNHVAEKPDVEQISKNIRELCYHWSHENACQILNILASFHPNPEVRVLEKMVQERKIIFVHYKTGAISGIGLYPAEEVPERFRPLEKKPHYLVLTVNPRMLFSTDKKDILAMMVALDHEALHYQQLLATGPYGWEFYKRYSDRAFDKIEALNPEDCRFLWDAEKEAVSRSCYLFNAWLDESEISELCRCNEDEFEPKLLEAFIEGCYGYLTECYEEWIKQVIKNRQIKK